MNSARKSELLNFRAPEGFHASVRAEAERRGITFAELIRQAVARDLAANAAAPDLSKAGSPHHRAEGNA